MLFETRPGRAKFFNPQTREIHAGRWQAPSQPGQYKFKMVEYLTSTIKVLGLFQYQKKEKKRI